jgi:precorrin-6B methylase 2
VLHHRIPFFMDLSSRTAASIFVASAANAVFFASAAARIFGSGCGGSSSPPTRAGHPTAAIFAAAPKSFSSSFLPKVIGSYEKELHEVIAGLPHDYSTIVDIGCAEGFYAVGLALKYPNARVFAFDTNPEARTQCQEMARINGVSERFSVGGLCDASTLKALDLGSRSLIISDCEGYERLLFDKAMAEQLRDHDLIIELHDFVDIEISAAIKSAFSSTHILTSTYSTDDIQKALLYEYSELTSLTLSQRRDVLAEGRPCVMEWLIARSRKG